MKIQKTVRHPNLTDTGQLPEPPANVPYPGAVQLSSADAPRMRRDSDPRKILPPVFAMLAGYILFSLVLPRTFYNTLTVGAMLFSMAVAGGVVTMMAKGRRWKFIGAGILLTALLVNLLALVRSYCMYEWFFFGTPQNYTVGRFLALNGLRFFQFQIWFYVWLAAVLAVLLPLRQKKVLSAGVANGLMLALCGLAPMASSVSRVIYSASNNLISQGWSLIWSALISCAALALYAVILFWMSTLDGAKMKLSVGGRVWFWLGSGITSALLVYYIVLACINANLRDTYLLPQLALLAGAYTMLALGKRGGLALYFVNTVYIIAYHVQSMLQNPASGLWQILASVLVSCTITLLIVRKAWPSAPPLHGTGILPAAVPAAPFTGTQSQPHAAGSLPEVQQRPAANSLPPIMAIEVPLKAAPPPPATPPVRVDYYAGGFCGFCGAAVEQGDRFCTGCGRERTAEKRPADTP